MSSRLLNYGTVDIWDQVIIFVVGNYVVYFRIFSSIPGLYPLEASNTHFPHSRDHEKCLQTLPDVSRWAELPVLKKPCFSCSVMCAWGGCIF